MLSKRTTKFKKIRELVSKGVLPEGIRLESVLQALQETKKPNVFEVFGFLSAKHKRDGVVTNLGLVSCQLVTTAFAAYLVDSLQDSTTYPMDVFKYHGSGTGNTAEANTQTTLVTEVESREAGTQIEGASANIYKTVATIAYTDTRTITEHGLFSAAAAGTMMDRSLFSGISVINTDEIEFTYELTVNAET